jgi:hypothetical protein
LTHTWEPPPPPPPRIVAAVSTGVKITIPLLLLLPLFLFRPNRTGTAWWIWLPIVVAALAATALIAVFCDGEVSLLQAVFAFLTGLAAVWLLTPYLKSRYRIVTFLKTFPALAALSLLAYVPTLLGDKEGWLDLRALFAGLLACASLVATLALVLAGLAVRRRFGRIRFLLWLTVWTVLTWTAVAAPFAVFELLGTSPEWGEFIIAVLIVSAITVALLLPLLLLAFFNSSYRARFAEWLNLPQPESFARMGVPPTLPGTAPATAAASPAERA